ncbi:MAG: zinc ABC transporter substrate-binding protein [Candidatus Gottesmanbacteria bacterium]
MKNNKLIAFILGVILIAFVSFALNVGFFKRTNQPASKNKKIQVVASFYPLYFFASQIGGDKVDVANITPSGAEPHDYEPSTQDIAHIERASILILNGGQLEAWGDKVKEDLKSKNVEVVTAADGLVTQNVQEEGQLMKDPHVWLDPVLAKNEVQKITQAFIKVDQTNITFYQANEKSLESKLDLLDQSFKAGLQDCQQKNIVTSHAAFGYVASRYGLNQVPISGLSPDQEPSPKQLADVAQFAKTNNVKYIFFETLISPKLSETIAKEVGAKTIVFNPLEGLTSDEQSAGKDYLSIQQDNLANLRVALECK